MNLNAFHYPFEKLEVWKIAQELTCELFLVTDTFLPADKFTLASQLTRAALSVSNNIAEGSGRSSAKDQAHFTTIAYSSLLEVVNILRVSKTLGRISEEKFNQLEVKTRKLSVKLCLLKSAQLNRKK